MLTSRDSRLSRSDKSASMRDDWNDWKGDTKGTVDPERTARGGSPAPPSLRFPCVDVPLRPINHIQSAAKSHHLLHENVPHTSLLFS